MTVPTRSIIRFDAFELDTQSGELRKQGRRVRLPEQSFQILTLLLARPGEVVTRADLRQRLWPDLTAGDFDSGLNNAIKKLRDALGDSAEAPRLIETLPRRGYRFLGTVEVPEAPVEQSAAVDALPQPAYSPITPPRRSPLWPAAAALLLILVAGEVGAVGVAHGRNRQLPRSANRGPRGVCGCRQRLG